MPINVVDSKRKKKRELLYSLGDDLLRYIAELVTNCDDSYRRIENNGISVPDDSKVIYIELKKGKRQNETDIIRVTDNAEGISKERMEEIFSTYGADNAGGVELHARGIFGQGASDVLRSAAIEKKTAMIESFRDGKFTRLKYNMDENYNATIDVTPVEVRSSNLADLRKKMRIPTNGTCISFGIPSSVKYKKNTKDKLKDMIETFPSFRYLLNQEDRKIILIIDDKETTLTSEDYSFDKMQIVETKEFNYNFQNKNLACKLKIFKNENKNNDKTNILVIDENKTVYDNTMFDFGNMTAAKNLSGELTINHFYEVCYENLNDENNPNAIVNDNRTGFDTKNSFYIGLNKVISPILDTIIKEHGEKTKTTDLTNNKKFSEALKKLNKYITNELKDTITGGNLGGQTAPIQGIKFVRSNITLTKGKTYDLKLLINSTLIFESDIITISNEINNSIEINQVNIGYTNDQIRNNDLVVKDVTIKAIELTNEPILVEAKCREYKAVVLVNVIDLDIHDPENGIEFYPKNVSLNYEGVHKTNLYFDKNIVPIGSKISLTSSDGLLLDFTEITTKEEHMLDENIGCVIVKSSGGNMGSDYIIEANWNDLKTSTKITLIDKTKNSNSGGGLISGIKLESSDAFYQAYYQPHTHEIIINSKNPINEAIMGNMRDKNPDKPSFSKEQTKYLCDIIAREAAKKLVEEVNARNGDLNLSDPQEAVQEFENLIQQHKNKMFMDIYPAMIHLSDDGNK